MLRILVVLLIAGTSAVLVLVALELLLRYWTRLETARGEFTPAGFANHGRAGRGSWLMSAEEAASRDPDFSLGHWQELQRWLKMRRDATRPVITDSDRRTLHSLRGPDFRGREFSVSGGERVTTGVPREADFNVICLGGSTTFCYEVSDRYTWPSVLQRLLAERPTSERYAVRNVGLPGVPGRDRIAWYADQVLPCEGDVAIFLFGDNDAGWVQWYPRSGRVHASMPVALRGLLYFSRRGIQLAGWLYGELSPAVLRRRAIETAVQTIREAEALAARSHSRGAHVLFVLQPNLGTLARKDDWDRAIMRGTARDLFVMLEAAYGCYREWISRSSIAVSATHIFDQESPSPYMGDWSHVNSRGNELIAQFVYGELMKRGMLGPVQEPTPW